MHDDQERTLRQHQERCLQSNTRVAVNWIEQLIDICLLPSRLSIWAVTLSSRTTGIANSLRSVDHWPIHQTSRFPSVRVHFSRSTRSTWSSASLTVQSKIDNADTRQEIWICLSFQNVRAFGVQTRALTRTVALWLSSRKWFGKFNDKLQVPWVFFSVLLHPNRMTTKAAWYQIPNHCDCRKEKAQRPQYDYRASARGTPWTWKRLKTRNAEKFPKLSPVPR